VIQPTCIQNASFTMAVRQLCWVQAIIKCSCHSFFLLSVPAQLSFPNFNICLMVTQIYKIGSDIWPPQNNLVSPSIKIWGKFWLTCNVSCMTVAVRKRGGFGRETVACCRWPPCHLMVAARDVNTATLYTFTCALDSRRDKQ